MKPTKYLLTCLQTLRDLPCVCLWLWAILPTNFHFMNQTQLHKQTVTTFAFLWAVLQWKWSVIRWLSRKKTDELKDPSNSPQTTLLQQKHWSLDLVQQSILFRGVRPARMLMLVTPTTPIFKKFCSNLTKVDFLEHCVVLYNLKDIVMIRELCSTTYWRTLPRFHFPLSLNTKQIPTCFDQNMISKVAIGSMLYI